jgi:hypothetical protein
MKTRFATDQPVIGTLIGTLAQIVHDWSADTSLGMAEVPYL